MKSCLVCCIGCFALSTGLLAQSLSNPDDSILNVLVWGIHMPIDPAAYSGVLKRDVDAYLQRASSYRPTREVPCARRKGSNTNKAPMTWRAAGGSTRNAWQ